jgi:DNA-binding transcriptional regulator PaaX
MTRLSRPPLLHHPDFSLTVARRRAGEWLIDLLVLYGDALVTRGRSLTWNFGFPSRHAYCNAIRRLRKKGLVVLRPGRTTGARIHFSATAAAQPADYLRPDRSWNRKWSGFWQVLMYDIPEPQRAFRDTLRRFLYQLRMGCLQRSVWVSPDDIRPEYDDLVKATHFDFHSFLFESRTVLGRSAEDVVRTAWDFSDLHGRHQHYRHWCERELRHLDARSASRSDFERLANEELRTYFWAMEEDPLLPRALHPTGYDGVSVFQLHQVFVRTLRKRMIQE